MLFFAAVLALAAAAQAVNVVPVVDSASPGMHTKITSVMDMHAPPAVVARRSLADDGTLVTTSLGTVQGTVDSRARAFKGIKYAQAPVGDLRWAPPVAISTWGGGVYNARYG